MKNKFIKVASAAFILMALLSVNVAQALTATTVFTDITSTSPYYNALFNLKSAGVISGYADGSFKPDNTINRAEFTKIVTLAVYTSQVNATCMDHYVNKDGTYQNIFTDVLSSNKASTPWFVQYVCFAKYNNIVSGYSDGSFKPNANVQYAEAAKILVKTYSIPYSQQANAVWYKPYTDTLDALGVKPASITSMDQQLTRGQMALLIFAIRNLNGNYSSVK